MREKKRGNKKIQAPAGQQAVAFKRQPCNRKRAGVALARINTRGRPASAATDAIMPAPCAQPARERLCADSPSAALKHACGADDGAQARRFFFLH
ncbi:hypothetical protein EBQ24_05675 [Allofranklinella schreckenbergeri]|uniref:Uncharacterized protein n=1 Tax=Allofranklinella schreckenbergeri TaxID=1076744 RepID=A0A3M6R543_9BURK|nr:hypothetical protein EBQ24_05675 [Allofranklinella schreckenbergeri]